MICHLATILSSQIERQQTIEKILNVIYRVRLMQKTSKYMKRHYLELTLEKNRAYYKLKQASDDIPIDFIGNEGAIFKTISNDYSFYCTRL